MNLPSMEEFRKHVAAHEAAVESRTQIGCSLRRKDGAVFSVCDRSKKKDWGNALLIQPVAGGRKRWISEMSVWNWEPATQRPDGRCK